MAVAVLRAAGYRRSDLLPVFDNKGVSIIIAPEVYGGSYVEYVEYVEKTGREAPGVHA